MMEHRAKVVLDRLADTLLENAQGSGSGPWMFGLHGQEPTALDAHTIVFVERIVDSVLCRRDSMLGRRKLLCRRLGQV